MIKLYFRQRNYPLLLERLNQLFELVPQLSKSYVEESITKMIARYSSSPDVSFINSFYNCLLKHSDSDRTWLKINTNLLNLYIENGHYEKFPELLLTIYERLKTTSESTQKSFTLEVIAAEIEYLSRTKNHNLLRMSQLYRKSLQITTAVTHPKILGTIRECGAKVQFYRGNFEKARLEFYESFKNYDEAGSPLKKQILKYLALCSLLTENEFDPFDTQETQTYAQMSEFANLLLLIDEYHSMNLTEFNRVLKLISSGEDPLSNDDIFKHASKQILSNLRSKALISYINSYKSIKLQFLSERLQLDDNELELLILKLVNSGRLTDIRIDFTNKIVYTQKSTTQLIPASLTANDIFYNIRALDVMNLDATQSKSLILNAEDRMDLDNGTKPAITGVFFSNMASQDLTSKPLSLLHKLFFSIDRPSQDKDWFPVIESWYSFMISAIPPSIKGEVSQMDQIYSEQRAENALNTSVNKPNDLANINTKGGLLNSAINPEENEADNDEPGVIEQVHKTDILGAWYNQARTYYDSLVTK